MPDSGDSVGRRLAAVNGRFLERPVTGVERFASEVTRRLGERVRVVSAPSWARGAAGHLWEQTLLPRRLRPGEVLWSPANSGPLAVGDQVITMHDAGPLEHPEWFVGAFARFYRYLIPRLVRRAAVTITSSRFSRDRLLALTGVAPERVVVVTPGVDCARFRPHPPEVLEEVRARYSLPRRYLLAVGSRSPRKNLSLLVSAWRRLRSRHPDLGLVVAGEPTYTAHADGVTEADAGIRLVGRVPDAELAAIYGAARLFVFPSLYEGFGLPVLEAMACGTPVVASSRAGIPEAAGDAGLLVEPDDPDALTDAVDRLLEDGEERRRLIAAGLERAQARTWEETAEAVLSVLVRCGA